MMFGYEMTWMMWLFASLMVSGMVVVLIVAVLAISGRRAADTSSADAHSRLSAPGTRSRAREILDERFARGDLSADQYSEHLRVLGEK